MNTIRHGLLIHPTHRTTIRTQIAIRMLRRQGGVAQEQDYD